jgi:phage tail tape-measure protein
MNPTEDLSQSEINQIEKAESTLKTIVTIASDSAVGAALGAGGGLAAAALGVTAGSILPGIGSVAGAAIGAAVGRWLMQRVQADVNEEGTK